MLRIGFSNRMFTLWNVVTNTEFAEADGLKVPFQRTSFEFVRNLSTIREEAIKKAAFLGCENFEIDFSLYGVNASQGKPREKHPRNPSDVSKFFECGPLEGTEIEKCVNEIELFWYYQQTKNIHCEQLLVSNFGYSYEFGQLVNGSQKAEIQRRNKEIYLAHTQGFISGKMLGNLSPEGVGNIEVESGVILGVKFTDVAQFEHRGRKYGLPVKNGRARRLKGKELMLKVGAHQGNGMFDVLSFRIFEEIIIY